MNEKYNKEKHFVKRYYGPIPVSYIKFFNSFEEGFNEIIRLNPVLKNYCGDTPIYDNVISSMLNIMKKDIPSLNNSSYPNTLSISIEANEVGFKTDSNIAIGWRTGFNFKTGAQYFYFRISYIRLPSYKKDVYKEMESAGWSKVEKEHRQSRFWDRIEGKPFRKNRDASVNRGEKNRIDKVSEEVSTEIEGTVEYQEVEIKSVNNKETDNISEEGAVIKDTEGNSKKETDESDFPTNYPMTKEAAIESFLSRKPDLTNSVDITWQDPSNDGKEVLIRYEEIMAYKMKDDNNISKGTLEGVYVVTHKGNTMMIKLNDTSTYGDAIINQANNTISFPDGISFDYSELK